MEITNREFAKRITKLLRANGIKAGIVKDNYTTSPDNPKTFVAFFGLGERTKNSDKLYMSFNMDDDTSKKIKDVLERNEIPHFWSGNKGACFVFVKYNLRICDECKKHTAHDLYMNNICRNCLDKRQVAQ